jgi:hypothetical protein
MLSITNPCHKISKTMKTPKTVSTPCGERLPFSLFIMWNGTLTPQSPLPLSERGSKPNFLFPSPAGEGLGVRALKTSP